MVVDGGSDRLDFVAVGVDLYCRDVEAGVIRAGVFLGDGAILGPSISDRSRLDLGRLDCGDRIARWTVDAVRTMTGLGE